MNGMREPDEDDQFFGDIEPDPEELCDVCNHRHHPEISCEVNLLEERLQAAVDRMEEQRKHESDL